MYRERSACRRRRPAAVRSRARTRSIGTVVEHVMSFIDPSAVKPLQRGAGRGKRHGRSRGGRGCSTPPCPAGRRRSASRSMAVFRITKRTRLIEDNRRDIVAAVIAQKADIGIAWDGDADRCFFVDGTVRVRIGRLRDGAAGRSVSPQASRRDRRLRPAGQPRRAGHRRRSTSGHRAS